MGDLPVGGVAFAEPNRLEIGAENWAAAERAAGEIIRKVQPTSVSEERRKEVVDYIQRLIWDCLGAEVKILYSYVFAFHRLLLLDTFVCVEYMLSLVLKEMVNRGTLYAMLCTNGYF